MAHTNRRTMEDFQDEYGDITAGSRIRYEGDEYRVAQIHAWTDKMFLNTEIGEPTTTVHASDVELIET